MTDLSGPHEPADQPAPPAVPLLPHMPPKPEPAPSPQSAPADPAGTQPAPTQPATLPQPADTAPVDGAHRTSVDSSSQQPSFEPNAPTVAADPYLVVPSSPPASSAAEPSSPPSDAGHSSGDAPAAPYGQPGAPPASAPPYGPPTTAPYAVPQPADPYGQPPPFADPYLPAPTTAYPTNYPPVSAAPSPYPAVTYPPVSAAPITYPPQPYSTAPYPPAAAFGGYGQPVLAAPYGFDPATGQPLSDKSKVVAGLLQLLPGAIFSLGGIGRLYAGNTGLGVGQLIVSVVGWIAFWCGFALFFVPWLLWGAIWLWFVIDGIVMLAGRPTDAQGRPLRS